VDYLAPQLAGASALHFLVSAILAVLYSREKAEYLRLWSIAYSFSGMRHAFAVLLIITGYRFLETLMHLMLIGAGLMLLMGTFRLLGKRVPKAWLAFGALVSVWAIVAPSLQVSFLMLTLPVFGLRGLSDMFAGYALLRLSNNGIGRLIAGISFVVWGFHRFNYPLLRPVEWFAPWGFALATVLGVVTGVGLLVLHYEKAKDELGRSEEKFRAMFENALDGYLQHDAKGGIISANPALVAMLGYDSEADLKGVGLPDIWATRAEWDAIIDNDGVIDGLEARWVRKDGRLLNVVIRMRQVRRSGVDYFEGSVRDMTQTKILQEQLELGRRLDIVGRLAGGVAHDFNNVLTAILAGADMVEYELKRGSDPQEDLEAIRIAARRAADLSSQLLNFSRQEGSQVAPVSVNEILDSTSLMLSRLLPPMIRLEVERPVEPVWIMAELGSIERILLNLAINAQDAMPSGGLLQISAKGSQDGGLLTIRVQDTGLGIDPDVLKNIFEPFFTTKEAGQGTGLGLSNVYRIVESLGGGIEVESQPGRGTEFRVMLPTCPPTDETGSSPVFHLQSGAGRLILLVEDQGIVRKSLFQTLTYAGYEVLAREDGESGLTAALENLDSLLIVISDVMMPVRDGVTMIDAILEERPDLPYLLISGFIEKEFNGRVNSDEHFLAKPFNTVELLSRVQRLTEQKESHESCA